MKGKLVLIDGHSILNRAFYGMPPLTNSQGKPTGAVYGFLNILFKILEEEKPQYLAVAFDLHAPTFRHKMYEAYKGTRKPMPEELREQVPVMKEVLRAMNVYVVELEGYEADDILGTLARRGEAEGLTVTIVSGDRDLLQLATDSVLVRIPKTRGGKTVIEDYHAKEVLEKYQLTPPQIVDLKSLMGDSSDNIPGIPGVGEKTATKILAAYGSLEEAYGHLEEIKPKKAMESLRDHYDLALLSKKLAAICTDSPLEPDWAQAELSELYTPEAYELFRQLDFKNLLSRFQGQGKPQAEPAWEQVEDFQKAEEIFEKAAVSSELGFALLGEGEIQGLAVSLSGEETYYIPAGGFLSGPYLREASLRMANGAARVSVFDLKNILKYLEPERKGQFFDVWIGAYLLNPLKASYTYDDIAREFLGMSLPSGEELFGTAKLPEASAMDPQDAGRWCALHAWTAREARGPMEEKLRALGMEELFRQVEMPLVFTLHDMEKAGIAVEGEALARYGRKLQEGIRTLEERIYRQAGETFNLNSPKQLGVVLFEKLKLPGGKKTKSGYSTAADVLEKLAPEAPVVADILEYRQLAKLKSTYADGLGSCIAPDGRIHSSFHQTITATGRISSTEPNLQNIPVRMELGRQIRRVFVPKEGCLFIDADYSQIELPGAGPSLRGRETDPGLPGGKRHPPHHRLGGVPCALRGGDAPAEAERQGGQFRHRLRHQFLRTQPGSQHQPERSGGVYRKIFPHLSEDQRVSGPDRGTGEKGRLRHHAVWKKAAGAGAFLRKFHAEILRRAGGHELSHPGHGGGYHQDRHGEGQRAACPGRIRLPAAAAGPRRTSGGGAGGGGGSGLPSSGGGDERGRQPVRGAGGGYAHGKKLVRRQVNRKGNGYRR